MVGGWWLVGGIAKTAPLLFAGATLVFAADPWPAAQAVLQERCIECHGEKKQKAGLRLDSLEALLRGGQSGPAFQPGKPETSALVVRTLMSEDDDDRMPPKGPHLSTAQIDALRSWITAYTPPAPAAVRPALPAAPVGPVPAAPAVDPQVLSDMAKAQVLVRVLPGGWWSVNAGHVSGGVTGAILDRLAVAGPAILDVDLSRSGITSKQLATLFKACPKVERLRLSACPIGDADLAIIAQSPTLTHLVLIATLVTDAGLPSLKPLEHLESLYLYQTPVTPAGSAALASLLPDCQINLGPDDLPSGAAPAARKKQGKKKKG